MKKLFSFLTLLLLLISLSCSGGGSSSGGGSAPPDYRFLYTHNASVLDGHTIRWDPTPIMVFTNGLPGVRAAFSRWGLPFIYNDSRVSSPVNNAITIGYSLSLSPRVNGITYTLYYRSGKIAYAAIYINLLSADAMNNLSYVIAHEAGHAIGFFGHTSDGGLMDPVRGNNDAITSPVRNMINLLYSMPAGMDITRQLGLKIKLGGRFQPNSTETIMIVNE